MWYTGVLILSSNRLFHVVLVEKYLQCGILQGSFLNIIYSFPTVSIDLADYVDCNIAAYAVVTTLYLKYVWANELWQQ